MILITTMQTTETAMLGAAPVDEIAAEKLGRLTEICERLWPAVRFFGLCGADPVYVAAVAELGEFLGKGGATAASATEIARKSRQEVVGQLAGWARNSPEMRDAVGSKGAGRVADVLDKLDFVE